MSRFKSLKEISLKKKIFIFIIVIAIIGVAVFAVVRFGFPDADITKPHNLAYEVGADSVSQSKFENAFDFFDDYCSSEQRADNMTLRNLNSFYFARLSVEEDSNNRIDRLLLALGEVRGMNKLNKKNDRLESLKKNVDAAKSDVLAYCENQIELYKNSTTDYVRISDYFKNFAKKITNYLRTMRDFENYLEEIIKTSTSESAYSNALTQFETMLNNKRLSLCVDACEKKFVEGESATINAPEFYPLVSATAKKTMFEQKSDAIKTFVKNKTQTIENIETVTKFEWLSDWLNVLGTDGEEDFVRTIDKATYDSFKQFIQTFFSVEMLDYPKGGVA